MFLIILSVCVSVVFIWSSDFCLEHDLSPGPGWFSGLVIVKSFPQTFITWKLWLSASQWADGSGSPIIKDMYFAFGQLLALCLAGPPCRSVVWSGSLTTHWLKKLTLEKVSPFARLHPGPQATSGQQKTCPKVSEQIYRRFTKIA